MCLAVPGKIIRLYSQEGFRMAKISFNGVLKDISVEWIPDVKVDDYVIVHAGSALTLLNTEEAEEALEIFRQIVSQ